MRRRHGSTVVTAAAALAVVFAAARPSAGADERPDAPVSARELALRNAADDANGEADDGADALDERLRLLGTLGRAGVSALFREDASTGEWVRKPPSDGMHTLNISSEDIARLGRMVRDRSALGSARSPAVARSTIDWREDTGEYSLTRVELGLFGKRLWFSRELSDESERDRGAVFLRFEW